jgi:hypothetical protein
MDRVNEQDKAILDLKARARKIRTYTEKLRVQDEECTARIKTLMGEGQKGRALIVLKQKKFIGKEMEKADGAQ